MRNAWTEDRLRQYLRYYRELTGCIGHIPSNREMLEGRWPPPEKAKVRVPQPGEPNRVGGGKHHPRGRRRFMGGTQSKRGDRIKLEWLYSIPWERLLVERIDIQRAFDTLRGRQRDVIAARFLRGHLTQEQVAEVLGISQPTVHEHEQAGIRNMYRALGENPRDPSGLDAIIDAELARMADQPPEPLPPDERKAEGRPYNPEDGSATIEGEQGPKLDPAYEELLREHEKVLFRQAWRAVYLTYHMLDFHDALAEIVRSLHLPGVVRWVKAAEKKRAAIWWQARRAANREIDRTFKRQRRLRPGGGIDIG